MPTPTFNADSAFVYVKKQVDFGPRVPNTEAHRKCAAWLSQSFKQHGLNVVEQRFKATHYKGTEFDCVNIIARYKPDNPRRILLAAHWDSRFQADQDTKNPAKPILGADDGASGVGILLEIARTLEKSGVDIGVDLICFDAEDQGNDAEGSDESRTWCLGAQHWAQNKHDPNYFPLFGILLDMVGASDAKFPKEGISAQAAPVIVDKVWATAASLGYESTFSAEIGSGITDDHYFVIKMANIPMIDIISRPGNTKSGFPAHWHTHNDDMSKIDKNTLKMVGQTCISVVFNNYNGVF